MSVQIRFQSSLMAAATLLCAMIAPSAFAQFPQRWHPTAAYDDEGSVVGVARSGNIYVAGRTKQPGTSHDDWDAVVIKYSAAGVFQWAKTYDAFDNDAGDDIIT